MAVESAADRAVFFNKDEHAVTAAYTLAAGGSSVDVDGNFDADHLALDVDAGVAVSSNDPRFHCAIEALPVGYGIGDTLVFAASTVFGGGTFKVVDPQEDGTGLIVLVLEKQ